MAGLTIGAMARSWRRALKHCATTRRSGFCAQPARAASRRIALRLAQEISAGYG